MTEKDPLSPEILHVPLESILGPGSKLIPVLLQEDVAVICVNTSALKTRFMPFKALYDNNEKFWAQKGSWTYFIDSEDLVKIRKKMESGAITYLVSTEQQTEQAKQPRPAKPEGPPADFGNEYTAIAAMSDAERVDHIKNDKKRLDILIAEKPRNVEAVTEALADTTRDAALVNHAALLDAMKLGDDDAKKLTQSLVDSTRDMVKSSSRLITPGIFSDELLGTLVQKSNGTIIQHMTRVYLKGMAFLSHYNELVSASSYINKLRISFDKTYRDYYAALLPHYKETLSLERIFMGGMRAIPEDYFLDWATGFLIHDVGKAAAVEYHEGEAAYNRDIVVEHVKVGFNSVMNKTNYPRDAALITGYHHEYYGDPGGYGCFRTYLEQHRKANPYARQEYCIAYDVKPMVNFEALAYFPAKILEIVDVFDSVTDPNRKYRKALISEEALGMMKEEFIDKHPKIDIILYDIFASFVRKSESL